ncbi:MAG TPA: metallophosphoesterase [Candidatus Limnocylindrales bacterium]|nr:metallophosphoesterase [Candidatus Limnocylindrales bacterium]
MSGTPPHDPLSESPHEPVPRPGSPRVVDSTQLALGALVFVATLVLLLGLASVWTRGGGAPGASGSGQAVGSPSPPPTVSASPTEPPTASAASTSPSPSLPSSSAAATDAPVAVLVGAGDIGDCGTQEDTETAALLDGIEGTVFTAGDNAYENGTAKEFATCYDETWGRHKERTRPAPGNHDWNTSGLSGYLGYFGDAAKGADGHSWYSYDLGAWHVIVLDSECAKVGGCGTDSPQGRWLAADLAASDARCTVAIWHKPRFTSGEHGNDRSVAPFWTALYRAGADVVINGHDHDYERFAPQDPTAREDRDRGIREFVVGTGGTPLRTFERPVANSELRAAVVHGVFKLTLREGAYDWDFVPVHGEFHDGGTAFCH